MGLVARLGGRSNRKVPIALFNDKDPVVLGLSFGSVEDRSSLAPAQNQEVVPLDETKAVYVVAEIGNGSGAAVNVKCISWADSNVRSCASIAPGHSATVNLLLAPGESYYFSGIGGSVAVQTLSERAIS